MNYLIKVYFKAVALLLGITTIISCESNIAKNGNHTQNILNQYKDSISDFGIVALIDNGEFQEIGSIGYSHDSLAISINNRFCIGSCSKMFTSVITLMLHEEGLLNINDSIYKYIPKHQFIDSEITIKQLLNHTSGLTDILKNGFMNEPFLKPYGDYSNHILFSKIDTIEFLKGSRYQYSNTNYFLLTEIIERVSDKSLQRNLEELIIEPLDLKNTFPYYSKNIDNLAHPIIDGQDLHEYPKMAVSELSIGSGNIVSDVYDLNTFLRKLLLEKTLLKKESLDLMKNFFTFKNTKSGLGLFEEDYSGRKMLGHTGRQISYISYAFVDPKTNHSIIVFNNNVNDEYIDTIFEELSKTDD